MQKMTILSPMTLFEFIRQNDNTENKKWEEGPSRDLFDLCRNFVLDSIRLDSVISGLYIG